MRNHTYPRLFRLLSLFILLTLTLSLLTGCAEIRDYLEGFLQGDNPPPVEVPEGNELQIHVIDVGQGDAILIRTPEGNLLIDAGDNIERYEQTLKNYLDALGIQTLDYFILTHPHADHIGGADVIFANYTVKEVIMPDKEATSKVYETVLDAIEQKDIDLTLAEPDMTFSLGALQCRILAPQKSYSDANDASVVIRMTYGSVSMMFTGDAEGNMQGHSEKDILAAYSKDQLQADFLKVGHHGSDTSSSAAFLAAVRPKLAAISVGEGNKYGHPIDSTLKALSAAGAAVYRTDHSGTLVFVCNGESIVYKGK